MKKKIDYETVIKGRRFSSYAEEVAYVRELIEKGALIPIKKSGTNGKSPALPLRYWKPETEEDYSGLLEEIRYKLSTDIDISFYFHKPHIYKDERKYVLLLSDYLKDHKDRLKTCISMNERSYDIWRREKFLSKEKGETVLKHCGIDQSVLNYYTTREPLAYFSATKDTPQTLLIIENLDTFYSIRKRMLGGNPDILGMNFGTIIYGDGKRISKAFEDYEICAEPYMTDSENRFYYFGDLDYEGILIYESFAEKFADEVEIIPFCSAYERMLDKVTALLELPDTKKGQNRNTGQRFFAFFSHSTLEKMKNILEHDKYIPQEILSELDFIQEV